MGRIYLLLLVVAAVAVQGKPQPRKSPPLPSVSDDHYQELSPDGSYKYAYENGEKEFKVEKRSIDGTIEGESVVLRGDGTPVRVHYTADKRHGYRPRSDILYGERRVTEIVEYPRHREVINIPSHPPSREVIVHREPPRRVVAVHNPAPPPPPVLIAPGRDETFSSFRNDGATHISNSRGGGDVAAAIPRVTAIVGPGGHADIAPEAYARTGDKHHFRGFGASGDLAVAQPEATAIVGPGGSVRVRPVAKAYSGSAGEDHVIRQEEGYHIRVPARRVYYEGPPPPPRRTYVEALPPPPPPREIVHVPVPVRERVPIPVGLPVHHGGVVVVPPNPSYSYEYSYSGPDNRHPFKDNKAYVSVRVGQ